MGEENNAFKILTRKPTGKILLGKPRHSIGFKEICVNVRKWESGLIRVRIGIIKEAL